MQSVTALTGLICAHRINLMKKASLQSYARLMLLIIAVVAGHVLIQSVVFSRLNQATVVAATPEAVCESELKKLWGSTTPEMTATCTTAYNIVANTKPYSPASAQNFCDQQKTAKGSSVCGTGVSLANEAHDSGASSGGSGGSSGSSSSGSSSGSSSSTANTTSSVPGANTFCKDYPVTAASSKVSRARCINAYEAGYDESGASRKSVCPSSSFSGAQLTSCTKAYDAGNDRGEKDRKAAAASAKAASGTDKCGEKGIQVSKALSPSGCIGNGNQNPIFALVAYGVQLLTGLFGIILVMVLVIAGFEYVISGDNPEIAKEAKGRITGAITGLVLFIIMFGLIQVILPSDVKIFMSS